MNVGQNPIIDFRVAPEQKRNIWIEVAHAGITTSDFRTDAVTEKVAQAREYKKQSQIVSWLSICSDTPGLSATTINQESVCVTIAVKRHLVLRTNY